MVKELEDIVYLFPNMFDVEHHQSVLPKYEDENCPPSAPKLMPDADVIEYRQQITYNRMSHVGLSVLLAIMQYTVISNESATIFKLYILLDNTQLALH